jgi:serine/threonine-protein kinase
MTRRVTLPPNRDSTPATEPLGWERAATDPDATVPAGVPLQRPDLLHPGELLGEQYEVVEKIGEGGMAQVYEAVDRVLGRRVALKVARAGQAVHALRDEARAIVAVRHPSMVTVFGVSSHRGMEYLAMERLRGTPLVALVNERRAREERFSLDEVEGILIAIADGLRAVHLAGLAHFDLKPGNVMLASERRLVLLDFGIARPRVAPRSEGLVGTPRYMAPEMFEGRALGAGGSLVDLYALGVLGFELLAGAPPYLGDSPFAMWTHHLLDPVPDVRERRTDAPEELARLLRDLMAVDPQARPQSAEEVLYRLGHTGGSWLAPCGRRFHRSPTLAVDAEPSAPPHASGRPSLPQVNCPAPCDARRSPTPDEPVADRPPRTRP